MSAILLQSAAIEEAPIEAVPAERPTEAPPAKAVVEIRSAEKITDIAQLPAIWKLEQNIEWLIDGIIPLGSITLLSGESGGGKTWLAYQSVDKVTKTS